MPAPRPGPDLEEPPVGSGFHWTRTTTWITAGLLLAVICLVALSLRRDPPQAFPPSMRGPGPAGDSLVGPLRVTIDASHPARWVFYDFSSGSIVVSPDSTGWDVAFRRFHVAMNGGPGLAGAAGAVDVGVVPFDSVDLAPDRGYAMAAARHDSTNPALARWYEYGFTSHLLTPKPRVYAVRTADGHFAKLRFLSYYCPGAQPGCLTFEYVYQGDGSRSLR